MGIGCDRGSIIIFGASKDTIVPTKKLDLINATGAIASFDIISAGVLIVRRRPKMTIAVEAIIDTIGPLNAKSNKAVRDGGNERNGVIFPNVPI